MIRPRVSWPKLQGKGKVCLEDGKWLENGVDYMISLKQIQFLKDMLRQKWYLGIYAVSS